MAAPGPPWEGASTAPLPAGPYLGGSEGYPAVPDSRGAERPAVRPRRRRRGLRRLVAVIAALVVLGVVIFGGLLLVTPSVSNAPALSAAVARAHHAVYPGPPVPARFAAALTATEDHRFYSEPGIDPFAVGRVLAGRVTGRPDQGGATLYQQLAKMLYTPGRSGLMVEAEQIMLGIKLALTYPKSEILQMYADVAYFGHGYYGLPAASCGYFREQPAQLSWPQAAMLAGLVQAPSVYDPLVHYTNARARQAHVLSRLVATGTLTRAEAAQFYRQPLFLVGGPDTACSAA